MTLFAECQLTSTRQSVSLPSAIWLALGKEIGRRVPFVRRVHVFWHSANSSFAECSRLCTRQISGHSAYVGFPVVLVQNFILITTRLCLFAVCQELVCRVLHLEHTANTLPCALLGPLQNKVHWRNPPLNSLFAVCRNGLAHGKHSPFAVCPVLGTRQTMPPLPCATWIGTRQKMVAHGKINFQIHFFV